MTLVDGARVAGAWLGASEAGLVIDGAKDPIPLHAVSAVAFDPPGPEVAEAQLARALRAGPALFFRAGESLPARVASLAGSVAAVELQPAAAAPGARVAIRVPLEGLAGFRLREAHAEDDVFEADLAAARKRAPERAAAGEPARADTVYVRRGSGLLRVEGVLRALDDEHLTLEFEGSERRLRRQLVLGVLLAPVAARAAPGGIPAVFELRDGGRFPAELAGIEHGGEAQELLVLARLPGAGAGEAARIPSGLVSRIRLASERVVFLSSLDPVKVEETPALGSAVRFPWRKDLSAAGGPLKLGGRIYRKGIGMHSRSSLEFDLRGRFQTFASTVGLEDHAGPRASVSLRVLADGRELFRKDAASGSAAEAVTLSIAGVGRLRLEVDYGADGLDLGDYAAWADARVVD